MQISISLKSSYDVADDAARLVDQFRHTLRSINLDDIESNVSLVYFPVIMSDEFDIPVKSHSSFSTKQRAYFSSVEISHAAWIKSNLLERRNFLVDGLNKSIATIKRGAFKC